MTNNPSFCTSLGAGWWIIDNLKVHESQMTPEMIATFQRNCGITITPPVKAPIPASETKNSTFWNGHSRNFLQVMQER
ncbi:hypothetical protein IQ230_09720 [Gloeocapsopsis crepidinum LEGE 06123]|uniref:Transposase n=1 Tax=Gloeocapsopsis crepidinum LEGE 06123 TaxID=588587 RepID=A0ABR9UQT6_9CHRO|nr:hypothetical protein [Gloeocapsopsis crepidinum]MBE9190634.1 hypothetical protein [Gloeocapsopsis crepidinum LEGE 06123]